MDETPRRERPEDAIADLKGQAAVLRYNGHVAQAETLERACARIERSIADWLDWIPEEAARARTKWGTDRLRSWFAAMAPQGAAELRGRTRYFRAAVLPVAANVEAMRAAGTRAGLEARAS